MRKEPSKSKGIVESWKYYVNKKVEQGWTVSKSKNPMLQFVVNPDEEADIKRIHYEDYAKVVKSLFRTATQYLILGEPLSLQGNGVIKARRIERDETKLVMTKPTINKFRNGGTVEFKDRKYFTYTDRCKMHWGRPRLGQENLIDRPHLYNYNFHIGRDNNNTGLKQRFSASNAENPNLKLGYDFFPSKTYIY